MASRNVFVAGLPPHVDDAMLKDYFSSCGKVLTAKVMLNIHTGLSRGFGFVLFQHHLEALNAVECFNGTCLPGTHTELHVAISKHDAEHLLIKTRKVLIRNIPRTVSREAISQHLEKFGHVSQCFHREENGLQSLLVEYDTEAAAQSLVHHTHGHAVFPGCPMVILAKLAEPITSRRKRLSHTNSPPLSPGATYAPPPMYFPEDDSATHYDTDYVGCGVYTHNPYEFRCFLGIGPSPGDGSAPILRAF